MSALVGDITPDKWPEPNYDDPETRTSLILGFMISGAILSIAFTAGRLIAKVKRSNKHALGLDDWLMTISTVMMLGVNILGCVSTSVGSGRHTWDVKLGWAVTWGKIDLATYVLFIPSVSLTKISLCVSYLRLFPSRMNQWFCYICITFLTLWSLTFIFLMMFACRPINGFWDPTIREASCLHIKELLILTGVLNSLTDFCVFLWPVKTLWSIRLPLLQRISLVVAFGIGCFVCLAGVVRAWYMEVYFQSDDPYWKAAILWIIVSLEGNLGIVCGCLPTLKPLAKMLWPRLFSSSSLVIDKLAPVATGPNGPSNAEEGRNSGNESHRGTVAAAAGLGPKLELGAMGASMGAKNEGWPFGNISQPGRGGGSPGIFEEMFAAKKKRDGYFDTNMTPIGQGEMRMLDDGDVWAEVDTRSPSGVWRILRTVTLHSSSNSRRNSSAVVGAEGNAVPGVAAADARHSALSSTLPPSTFASRDPSAEIEDDRSEEHILRPSRRWYGQDR
ncbi:putative integral membrane protein [Lasiodiplodia theobromae]|uniref:Integral membrane protein n=1 Tax=Lasiodiplodia theobromae TaxID=45133 RepID=A0A8H7IQ42_9PEZI|nr:putative integral membrane protein [Lasiodiplodia theobromae]